MDRLHKHIATLLEGLVEEAQERKFAPRNAVVQPAAEPEPEANRFDNDDDDYYSYYHLWCSWSNRAEGV